MKKLFYICLVAALSFISTINLSAQKTEDDKLPFEQLGFGTTLGSFGNYGFLGVYALDKNIHIGAKVGFYYDGGYTQGGYEVKSQSFLTFAPYVKYYFEKVKYAYPFLQASFAAETFKRNVIKNGVIEQEDATATNLNLYGGADWYPYKGVGVTAAIRVIQFNLDPAQFIGGLGDAYIGITFFL